ncbi:hypothetical protein JW988_06960 [Candidatus Bathyarchaeota archaeon]|nr:hypothetical protein [Candidatus Bathyarchaeota archaeon]
MLTQTVNDDKIVISAEAPIIKENIVDRKTIVYEANIDPTVIRVSGEKLKQQLFAKFGLFKPKSEEIQFISLDKYYEPYIVISGKYFLDYYRKCTYVFKVDQGVKEVVLLDHKFIPETSKSTKTIKLHGEERLNKDGKAFLILDKYGKDAMVDNLPSAPSEKKPEKIIAEYKIEEIPEDADVNYVRRRIGERPRDVSRVVEEVFEITDRSVIYTPRFKLLFRNLKTGDEKVMIIDGVTSEKL